MSEHSLLERIKILQLKAINEGHLHCKPEIAPVRGKENTNPTKCSASSKAGTSCSSAGFRKPSLKPRLLFSEQSSTDVETHSEYVTCSENVVLPSGSSNAYNTASSYTNLPSLTGHSISNASAPLEALVKNSKNGSTRMHSYRSDSALRHSGSTDTGSSRKTSSLKDCKFPNRSTSSIKSQEQQPRSLLKKNPEVEINDRTYIVIGSLGSGGSSKVYQVLDVADNRLCALKCVDLLRSDEGQKEAYLNEIQLLKRLSNTGCVIKLFNYEIKKHYLYIVMEKGDIDLASFLTSHRAEIDDLFIRFYWAEMLKCVNLIHKEGIVHLDLKPANFLFVRGTLKLIDFGIASALPSNKTSVLKETQMGTLSYMAPEVLKATGDGAGRDGDDSKSIFKVNRKADVWSLGCILYNMVYGCTPYQKFRSVYEKVSAIISSPVNFEPIEDSDLLDVMKRCLEKDPNKRASVDELLNHRYVKSKRSTVFDQSVMLKDDDDFLKLAEDLRQRTPRSFARKLRDLIIEGKP